MNILEGRNVFITGASSGIGRACAFAFAREGTRLLLCARRADRIEADVPALRTAGAADVRILPLDVRDTNWKAAAVKTGLSLADMEKEYIETVLREHEGHRGKTARALGIDPKTLYNKLGPERPRKKAVT